MGLCRQQVLLQVAWIMSYLKLSLRSSMKVCPQADVEKEKRVGSVVANSNLEAYVGCANNSHRLGWGGWRPLIHSIEKGAAYVWRGNGSPGA